MTKLMAGVKLAPKEMKQIQSLVNDGFYLNISDFLREAVRDRLESIKVVTVRNLDIKKARKEIIDYLQKRKGEELYPDELMEELGIDLEIVLKVLKELKKEGRIEE
ncbi:MAG: hypothetical protein ISS48_02355 [Candidatus Aenigmarchaeota archaeon]|nr:hypothetical protein [Candidatus Aenigmarchaeota archaeon]